MLGPPPSPLFPYTTLFRSRFGNPYAVTHRADIHGALLDGCREQRSVELRASTRVTGFRAEGNGVVVEIYGGERISAAALIGADGGRPVVRERILGDGEPPVSGHMCYRAVLQVGEMPKDPRWAGATRRGGPTT